MYVSVCMMYIIIIIIIMMYIFIVHLESVWSPMPRNEIGSRMWSDIVTLYDENDEGVLNREQVGCCIYVVLDVE